MSDARGSRIAARSEVIPLTGSGRTRRPDPMVAS